MSDARNAQRQKTAAGPTGGCRRKYSTAMRAVCVARRVRRRGPAPPAAARARAGRQPVPSRPGGGNVEQIRLKPGSARKPTERADATARRVRNAPGACVRMMEEALRGQFRRTPGSRPQCRRGTGADTTRTVSAFARRPRGLHTVCLWAPAPNNAGIPPAAIAAPRVQAAN